LMATSRTPNMRPGHGAQRLRGRVRGRLVSRFRASGHNRWPRVTLIGAGLFVLVVLTTWAIASVSFWWVPVYLALLVVIFVTPPSWQSPSSGSKSGVESDTVGIADLGSGLRVDCGDGVDELRSLRQFDSDRTDVETTESTDSNPHLTMAGIPRPRGRVRARKAAKPASEPVTDSVPVAWIQVGPGKFVRAEDGIQAADPAPTEEGRARAHPATDTPAEATPAAAVQTEPPGEQESFTTSGASPGNVEPILVSDDRDSESGAEEYGIAPSAFSLVTGHDSPANFSDRDLPGQADQPEVETAAAAEPDGQLPPTQAASARLLWQAGVTRRWVSRIQRGIVLTAPRVSRASSRRMIRSAPNSQLWAGTSYAPNLSRYDAARRAFGRTLHVQHTLRTRSPPCR
jgi:hypothetical protein